MVAAREGLGGSLLVLGPGHAAPWCIVLVVWVMRMDAV